MHLGFEKQVDSKPNLAQSMLTLQYKTILGIHKEGL